MSEKEYISIFESILYAAIVTQYLMGWSKMIKERGSYQVYWVHILIGINFFMYICQRYFAYRDLLHYEYITNTLTFMLIIIIPLASAFLLPYILFPKTNQSVDFRKLLVENRFLLCIAAMIPFISSLFNNIMYANGNLDFATVAPNAVNILFLLIFMITKSLRFLAFYSVFAFFLVLYFVFTY